MILIEIIFWCCILAVGFTYVGYPMLLFLIHNLIKKPIQLTDKTYEPLVYILIAAFNEELVIEEKLQSILNTNYTLSKIKIVVGSDASTDATDSIVNTYATRYPNNVECVRFKGRTGKPEIINQLRANYFNNEAVYVLTDANVFFTEQTIPELIASLSVQEVGLVAANVLNIKVQKEGIGRMEKQYIGRENKIKYIEGAYWGSMMGAFGACYAVKANSFPEVPKGFIVDDFYITMYTLQQKQKAIVNLEAICHEDVPGHIQGEFRRKARISAGNFQNLAAFGHLLWPKWKMVAFSFWSHKVLRWMGPIFIILAFFSNLCLFLSNPLYKWTFLVQVALLLLALIEMPLKSMNIHWRVPRLLLYFLVMNAALLKGLFKYLSGVSSNVWQPTERNG